MPPGESDDFVRAITRLVASGSEVVVIGGLAIQMHGSSHITQDADFVYRRTRNNAKKIADALREFHPLPVNWPDGVPFIWDEQTIFVSTVLTLETDLCRLDLLGEPDGAPSFDQLKANASVYELEGLQVYVASIDDLISMKRAAGRPKDLAHIAELETIKRLIAEEGLGNATPDHL